MGVVTDVTVKGLTTAVTNISATGMSDTTGQAIVSAINGLSGSISPAASNVTFDNTGTDLTSSNAESAIKEVNTKVGSGTFKISEHYTATTSAYGSINISNLIGKTTSNISIFNIFALNSNYANGIVSTLTVVGTNYFATFRDASNNNLVSSASLDLYINYYEV